MDDQTEKTMQNQGIRNKKAVQLDGFGLLRTVFWRRDGDSNPG